MEILTSVLRFSIVFGFDREEVVVVLVTVLYITLPRQMLLCTCTVCHDHTVVGVSFISRFRLRPLMGTRQERHRYTITLYRPNPDIEKQARHSRLKSTLNIL